MEAETTQTETPAAATPAASFFDNAPEAAASTPEATPAAPEVTLPDYEHEALKAIQGGKYRTFADIDKAQAAAVDQIRKLSEQSQAMKMRLGQFAGPPLDEDGKPRAYTINAPEDAPLPLDPESPEFQAVQEIATKYGAPEGMLQELHDKVLLPQISALIEHRHEVEAASLAEYYGSPEAMVAGARETSRWLVETLGEDKTDLLKRAMSTADAAFVLDLVRRGWGNVSLADKGGGNSASSVADLKARAHALRNSDPEMKSEETKAAWNAMNEAEAAERQRRQKAA